MNYEVNSNINKNNKDYYAYLLMIINKIDSI